MSQLMIARITIMTLLVLLLAVLGLMYPEYVIATPAQTEIPVNKLKCTDIRDGICVEWTEYKIVRY